MAGWNLLRSVEEWDQYRQFLAGEHTTGAPLVSWGNGPKHYPCLVASLVQADKVTSCYVYDAEAMQLLKAAGLDVAQPTVKPKGEVPGHSMADFAKSVAAHLMAFYDAMESMHITTKQRHFEDYFKYLVLVDQYHADDKAALATKLGEGQEFILEQLFPQDPDADAATK